MIIKKIKSIEEKELFSKKIEQIKTINVEIIDDRDANLNNKENIIQLITKIIKNLKDIAKIIPRYVATPFPPLSFNQIGKIWPIKQIKAENEIWFSKYINVINIDKYPFNKSKINVVIAKVLLPVLRTLVVPIFPEPTSLISFLRNIFVKINPKGIDPNK